MAHGYGTKLPNLTRYPGDGYYYVICDVCSRKIRFKDAVYVLDRFNTQNKLLVCKEDADKANAQLRPFKARERTAPKLTRVEATDTYVINPNSSRAPSAPLQLKAFLDPLTNAIDLTWLGPNDGGTDPITGYVIYQSSPQGDTLSILVANTNSAATFYQDVVSETDDFYSYAVAAINAFGTGVQSVQAYYPFANNEVSGQLLKAGPSGYYINTGSGQRILAGTS